MVGIIIATHGGFADGIRESGEMIFGEQENVQTATLRPDQGPEDIYQQMKDGISSFENQDEVLFLIDLWGGTPFNQASKLVEEEGKNWVIVTGLNLPMLIEAFGARLGADTAKDVMQEIIGAGKEGVKVFPEELMPKEEAPKKEGGEGVVPDSAVKNGAIPPGTVIGDGEMDIVLARIDSRLLHGQVATSWTKSTNPNRIIVVSDNVAHDKLRKSMIEQAAPPGVRANVVPISKIIEVSDDPRFGKTKAMLLFETPQDALDAIKGGVEIDELNLGSLAHSKGKVAVSKAVSIGKEDYKAFEELEELGVKIDVRKVPTDSPENFEQMMQKAKQGLE